MQKPAHYREAHHSQTDTLDKVIPDEINEGAALLAAWAWNVFEMPGGCRTTQQPQRGEVALVPAAPNQS